MILVYFLVILFAVNGSFAQVEDDDADEEYEKHMQCMQQEREECDTDFDLKFPDSTEELKTMCRDLRTMGRCLLRVKKDCLGESSLVTALGEALDYLDTVCQDDNPTFEEISKNLKCIEAATEDIPKACDVPSYSEETKGLVSSSIEEMLESASLVDDYEGYSCVMSFWENVCASVTVGAHCGMKTQEAVYNVLSHIDLESIRCGDTLAPIEDPLGELFEATVLEKLAEENEIGEENQADEEK